MTVLAASFVEIAVRIVIAGVLIVATTVLSLRLLGARRGWGTAFLAAVIGWTAACLLALTLSDWNWGADGLVVHILAIGVPLTMATAVTLDLLARPGSLAIGERAGLVVAPRPMRAVGRRVAVWRRYQELVRLARREGFGPLLSAQRRAERSVEPEGVRLRRVLEEAGGVYVKLGQIAATRIDLLPPEVCEELAKLQNRVEPEPIEGIRPVLEAELGGEMSEVFADFDWECLAAASIGQTYRARLRTGEAVVVKIQRPGIVDVMERDLAALAHLADVVQRRTPFGQDVRAAEILGQFGRSLRAELDFLREADAMEEMARLVGTADGVRIPKVYRNLCTRRVLVQERFEGSTIADATPDRLGATEDERRALAEQLCRSMFDQILKYGYFHADPHPGNVFVLSDGALGLIDFGAMGRLDTIQQAAIVDMFAAIALRDIGLLRESLERVADVTETVAPERLERVLARLVADHVHANGVIDPAVMQELVAVMAPFGIRLPGDLVLLSRSLATLDGTLRVISPGVSLVGSVVAMMESTTEPLVDRDAMVKEAFVSALPHLRRLPDRLDRILMLAGRGDLRIRHIVDEDSRRILRTLANRALLAAIGATFLLVSALLLVPAEEGPMLSDEVGLFEILGYGGLVAGTVLLLRVVGAVARDGTT